MEHMIYAYLRGISLDWTEKRAIKETAAHFNASVKNGRYLLIDGVEYRITKDMKSLDWKVERMTWKHGNNFQYSKPY